MTDLAKLHSEDVVVDAPMSFTGSAKRLWKLTPNGSGPLRWLGVTGVTLLIALVWVLVACWYLIFGLFLVPYRLLRRSQRKSRRQALQHRETLALLTEIERRESTPGTDLENAR